MGRQFLESFAWFCLIIFQNLRKWSTDGDGSQLLALLRKIRHITYIHVYMSFLSLEMVDWSTAFGVKRMLWQTLLPDLLRETRYFLSPSSCPWGAFGLILVISSLAACCCGFILGGVVFSNQCRRITAFAARALLASLAPPSGGTEVTLRDRLAEYHRSG